MKEKKTFFNRLISTIRLFALFRQKRRNLKTNRMILGVRLIRENDPCHQNREKIDDFIAIFEPINCALYGDKIIDLGNFVSVFCFKRS
jgi:hypothetical protein